MIEYKALAQKAIEELDNDGFEKLEEYLEKRDDVLATIKELDFSKEEFKELEAQINVLELEEVLVEKIRINRDRVKGELAKINKAKNMNSRYSKSTNSLSFVNIKI